MAAESWESLLRAPNTRDHVVQLYTDDDFLLRAVTLFIASGLAQGEAGLLVATPEHRQGITERLAATIDVSAALARDQLVMLDADTCLARFMADGVPDRATFFQMAHGMLDRVQAAGHPTVRVCGEMVNLLCGTNPAAAAELEALWGELLEERPASLLCAYRIDNFDHHAHRGLLHRLGRSHSHLVPVEDYARLEAAVERAYRDVFGYRPDTDRLRELMATQPSALAAMPPAEAALLALRDIRSDIADDVLSRTRYYYTV